MKTRWKWSNFHFETKKKKKTIRGVGCAYKSFPLALIITAFINLKTFKHGKLKCNKYIEGRYALFVHTFTFGVRFIHTK
jgi:hypothetical protein